MTGLIPIVIAYLLGSIPFGYVLTRLSTGRDVRARGAKHWRDKCSPTAGKKLGIVTLALDILKGVAAVALAEWLTGSDPMWMALSALAVSAGHVFPVFLNFNGGKAVATFAGAFGYLMPLVLVGTLITFILAVGVTKHISAGSVLGAVMFPLGAWLILHPSAVEMLAVIVACALIVYRHKANIERIRLGTESVFRWSKQ